MQAFTSFLTAELAHCLRHPSDIIGLGTQALLLFMLIRFGMPADMQTAQSLPALLLGAMTVSLLHVAGSIFDDDAYVGRIAHWHYGPLSFEWIVAAKYIVLLCCCGIPLSVIFSLLLLIQQHSIFNLHHISVFVCTSSAIIGCGCLGAAMKPLFNQHHFISIVLMFPFLTSVIIFNASALLQPSGAMVLPAAFAICFPLCSIILSSFILKKCY